MIQTLVDWQLNHFKPRTAKTKQRSEVRGSTAKIYAQKGTGGARHSSRKAPIFVGGGVAHGPKGAVYKIKKINKKVRKLGLFHILFSNINTILMVIRRYEVPPFAHIMENNRVFFLVLQFALNFFYRIPSDPATLQ